MFNLYIVCFKEFIELYHRKKSIEKSRNSYLPELSEIRCCT